MQTHTPPPDDRYARESFTFRRMKPWQIWTMSTVVAVLVIGFIAAYYM
jgi:hypothetical protein